VQTTQNVSLKPSSTLDLATRVNGASLSMVTNELAVSLLHPSAFSEQVFSHPSKGSLMTNVE